MKRTLLGFAVGFVVSTAAANDLDPGAICPPDAESGRQIDPVTLVYAASDAVGGGLSRGVFDANKDGTETMRERVDVILDPDYCGDGGTGRCASGDAGALDDVRWLLQFWVEQHIRLERVATPTSEDEAEWPMLSDTEYGKLAEILDDRRRYQKLFCADRTAAAPVPQKRSKVVDRLRVTGDIDSLSLPRGGPALLRAVSQAEVAYTDNRLLDSETFQIKAFAGYDIASAPSRQAIPFVGFERGQTRKPGPDPAGTSKVSAGFLYAAALESLDKVGLAAIHVTDRVLDSRQVSVRATWSPGFLHSINGFPMERARDFGLVTARTNLQLSGQVWRVQDAGRNEALAEARNYALIGPVFNAEFWPSYDRGLLSRLSADVEYRRLFKVSGPHDVERFGAGLNYSIEPTDHVTLRYSYESGDDEDTLEKTKQWKLTFGVRF